MKIALYITDGREQIVLTPETEVEHAILGQMTDETRAVEVYRGTFYDCAGGWTRQREPQYRVGFSNQIKDESTIIVLQPKSEKKPS